MPFDAHCKAKAKSPIIIRTASAHELTNYEKFLLKTLEMNAQENRIENIRLDINGKTQLADISEKEAIIKLGSLASQNKIYPEDFSSDIFTIECVLEAEEKGV
jgi:hypothetical protein